MTLTKVTAALCGALLVLLLGKWTAEALYHVESPGDAAYAIEIESADDGQTEVAEIDLDALMAQADIGKGAQVYKKCAGCHKLTDGVNAAGPYLYGVVGRPIAAASGFGFSPAMSGKGGDWTAEALNDFLTKPKAFVPKTTMTFPGLKKQGDRVNVIAYLDSLDD